MATYDFGTFCKELGKSTVFVSSLQRKLNLHVCKDGALYSDAYLSFMEGVVALRTFSVSLDLISETFAKEKKLLQMLHFDTMANSPTWYLDACGLCPYSPSTLLLTGQDVGFPLGQGAIQKNLNFNGKPPELFKGSEMGEDIGLVVTQYLKLTGKILNKLMNETPVLRNALAWSIPVMSNQ